MYVLLSRAYLHVGGWGVNCLVSLFCPPLVRNLRTHHLHVPVGILTLPLVGAYGVEFWVACFLSCHPQHLLPCVSPSLEGAYTVDGMIKILGLFKFSNTIDNMTC